MSAIVLRVVSARDAEWPMKPYREHVAVLFCGTFRCFALRADTVVYRDEWMSGATAIVIHDDVIYGVEATFDEIANLLDARTLG